MPGEQGEAAGGSVCLTAELLEQLQTRYAQGVIPVGDCEGGTNLYDATHTAFFGALRVL